MWSCNGCYAHSSLAPIASNGWGFSIFGENTMTLKEIVMMKLEENSRRHTMEDHSILISKCPCIFQLIENPTQAERDAYLIARLSE
jgi:hypothetical protein